MTTRNLFERPDLLDNQTRLILSADAKPRRLIRSAAHSVGQAPINERSDSPFSEFITQETDDDLLIDNDRIQSGRRTSPLPDSEIDYDTDIEQEPEPENDHTCKGIYIEECRRHGVIPSTHYLRHLKDDSLTIRYCGLKPINIKVMVPSLIVNSTITKIDLRDNGIGSRGAIYIAHLIKENEYIDELDLGNNDIGTQGCKALCQVLCVNRSIRILNLDGNRFNDDCAPLFAEVFSHNEFITSINLNKNFFENETTGRLFGQSLSENTSLEEVYLSWNRLTNKACGHILKPLANNTRLITLDLSWNGAGLFAAKAINDLLKTNTILENLYLDNNRFNTECATYIGKGLSKNQTLKILTLNGNPLESSGCYAVIRPLVKHPASQLQIVDLRGIIINNDFLDLVNELAGVLPQLTVKMGREREKEIE